MSWCFVKSQRVSIVIVIMSIIFQIPIGNGKYNFIYLFEIQEHQLVLMVCSSIHCNRFQIVNSRKVNKHSVMPTGI